MSFSLRSSHKSAIIRPTWTLELRIEVFTQKTDAEKDTPFVVTNDANASICAIRDPESVNADPWLDGQLHSHSCLVRPADLGLAALGHVTAENLNGIFQHRPSVRWHDHLDRVHRLGPQANGCQHRPSHEQQQRDSHGTLLLASPEQPGLVRSRFGPWSQLARRPSCSLVVAGRCRKNPVATGPECPIYTRLQSVDFFSRSGVDSR